MLFWCLFPRLHSNEGNKHPNNTRADTLTVRDESTYISLFLARHNGSINDDKTTIFTHCFHCFRVSPAQLTMTSQPIAEAITMTNQVWRDHLKNNISILFAATFTADVLRNSFFLWATCQCLIRFNQIICNYKSLHWTNVPFTSHFGSVYLKEKYAFSFTVSHTRLIRISTQFI